MFKPSNLSTACHFNQISNGGQLTVPVSGVYNFSDSLTLVLLNLDIPCFANSVDPDQLASEEAN